MYYISLQFNSDYIFENNQQEDSKDSGTKLKIIQGYSFINRSEDFILGCISALYDISNDQDIINSNGEHDIVGTTIRLILAR